MSVTLRNYYNQTRHQGGDHLRARIFNTTLEAYAPGRVIDHNNGSYTVVVSSFWPGRQTISVMLVYRREIVRSLYYMRQKVNTCIWVHFCYYRICEQQRLTKAFAARIHKIYVYYKHLRMYDRYQNRVHWSICPGGQMHAYYGSLHNICTACH